MDFSSRLVVITGIGRAGQLGEALALAFAQKGASLALVDRLADEVEARKADIAKAGFEASAHVADLTSANDMRKLVADITSAHAGFEQRVTAVICAAGGFAGGGSIDELTDEQWQRMLAINLQTAFETTRAFLPLVRNARGAFVYYTSTAVLPGGSPKGMAAYAAAKSGVVSLMKSVSVDERRNGVRANAIAPTAIRTAANIDAMGADKEYVDRESVADVTLFLASELSRNITGQVLSLA